MPYENRYLGLARYAGTWWETHERPRKRPDPGGRTPSELDFCTCGSTFQPVEGSRKRRCFECGAWEHERRSWHERTGVPYSRGYAVPLPEVDVVLSNADPGEIYAAKVEMNGHKVVEGDMVPGESPGHASDRVHETSPSTAHRNESTEAKAARLVREGKVTILYAERVDLWSAVVTGDTGEWLIARDPSGPPRCECPQGTRPHSHSMAAQAVVEGMLS